MPENPHNDHAQTEADTNERQPMKKQPVPRDKLAVTFAILGGAGAFTCTVLRGKNLEIPLIWMTFATICFFLLAIYFHWQNFVVTLSCFVFGTIALIGCVAWFNGLGTDAVPTPTPNASPTPRFGLSPRPTPDWGHSPVPVPVAEIDREKLLSLFEKYNDAQAEDLVKPYLGKQMEIEGNVVWVRNERFFSEESGKRSIVDGITVAISTERKERGRDSVITQAQFEEQRWIDSARLLRPGEHIKVRGRIRNIFFHGFVLTHSEIIR